MNEPGLIPNLIPNLIYVTGGARSGKSRLAERRAGELAGGGQVTYLATAQAFDTEMTERTLRHRQDRPAGWPTLEEPLNVAAALGGVQGVVLLDCLSLWVSNLMLRGDTDGAILQAAHDLMRVQRERGGPLSVHPLIVVSNEVGSGIVPDNALARRYRDTLGWVNQAVAEASSEAWMAVSGLPMRLK